MKKRVVSEYLRDVVFCPGRRDDEAQEWSLG